MIINGSKYILSRGVAFYPEKEMSILESEAQSGWHLKKITAFGFLKLQKGKAECKKFSVDFFTGKPEELDDYLMIYQQAGWTSFYNYKKKYFYFKSDRGEKNIYSDALSYKERMRKEWLWLFWRNLFYVPLGLFFYWLSFITKIPNNVPHTVGYVFSRGVLMFLGTVFSVMPLSVLINTLFSMIIYRKRSEFYGQPERFAKKQHYTRDILILMVIGFCIGAVMSLLLGDLY